MKHAPLLPICGLLLAAIGCHNNDPGITICKPRALLFETDSVVYTYNDDRRITVVTYYFAGLNTKRDDFTYDAKGLLATVAKSSIAFDGTVKVDANNTISYNDNGLPASLTTDSYAGHFVTDFTHDASGLLSHAETFYGPQRSFVGKTRYEYDANGNVPKVYYTINLNQQVTEVLARENLSFDDKSKFYVNSPELRICNEYVYGYLPNRNNCLSSTVYYYSYAQHFSSPLSVTFTAAYDEQGVIKSLQSDRSTQLNSGEVLFKTVSYSCR